MGSSGSVLDRVGVKESAVAVIGGAASSSAGGAIGGKGVSGSTSEMSGGRLVVGGGGIETYGSGSSYKSGWVRKLCSDSWEQLSF